MNDVTTGAYTLPAVCVWDDWRNENKGNEHPSYEPTARQRVIMDVVAKAIDDGVFYHSDMVKRVASDLGFTGPAQEGSVFGTDVYLARRTVDAKRKYYYRTAIAHEMRLKPGDSLGTLIFNDYKMTTGVSVESISEDGCIIKASGKRGAYRVTADLWPENIKNAIDRAHGKGKRKTCYMAFIATRHTERSV